MIYILSLIGILLFVLRKNIIGLDILISENINFIYNTDLTNIMKMITFFGSSIIIIMVLLLFMILVKNKNYKKYLTINLIISFILNNFLKIIFIRERPMNGLVYESSYSFPSGHAMISTLFYGLIIYFILKSNIKYKKVYCSLLIVLIILISFSRIYLNVHYLSDVLVGIYLSIIQIYLFNLWLTKHR